MKKIFLVIILVLNFTPFALADSGEKIEVGNKICPISGEEVDDMHGPVKVEYNGKIYNLCCMMCKKDFKKNPEKYSKIAEEEAASQEDDVNAHEHHHGVDEHHHP